MPDTHEELIAKITGDSAKLEFGDIRLDSCTKCACGPNGQVYMNPFEYQIIWLLVRGQGSLFSSDELLYFLYNEEDDFPLSNTLDVYLCKIRKKVAEISNTVVLTRVIRMGTCLHCRAHPKGPD